MNRSDGRVKPMEVLAIHRSRGSDNQASQIPANGYSRILGADIAGCVIERWRPADERPEILDQTAARVSAATVPIGLMGRFLEMHRTSSDLINLSSGNPVSPFVTLACEGMRLSAAQSRWKSPHEGD